MFKKIDINSLPENVRGLVNKTKTELLNIIDRKDNVEKELNIRKDAFISKYSLVIELWREKWKYENAKVSFVKREITSKEFIAAMGDTEEKIHDISNKIAIADFELKKLYERKQ